MIPIHVESAWKGTSDCRSCGIRDLVLFADLNEDDFGLIHAPIDDMAYPVGGLLWYRDWETDRKSTRLNSSHRL